MPLALRCVGPARRGAVLYGSASNLSPVVGPARRGTACGTTSGGALEPGCRRTAHCRQRRFAASTAVSLILLRAESRRMGETAVDVAKVRSRSPHSSDARPRSTEASTCPVELVRTPRSRVSEYNGGIPGGGSIWCHALPSARVRRSSPRRASTISRRYVQNFQNFTVFRPQSLMAPREFQTRIPTARLPADREPARGVRPLLRGTARGADQPPDASRASPPT